MFLEKAGFDLDMPSLEPLEKATQLRVFGHLAPRNFPNQTQLFSATRKNLDDPGEPDETIGPTLVWEGASLRDPVWLPLGLGTDRFSAPLLFYGTGSGALGVMWREADGMLSRAPHPLLLPGRLSPAPVGRISPVLIGSRLRLYFVGEDQTVRCAETEASQAEQAVLHGTSADFSESPALLRAQDFSVALSRSQTVPAERISAVFVRNVRTPAGRDRFDLYARAEAGGKATLVAASSFSGTAAEPFLPVSDPLLAETGGATPGGPQVAESGRMMILWLGLKTISSGISVAVQQKDLPPSP